MALPEILQWAQYGRKTGTVIFERRGVVKKVFIEDGAVVSASSNDPREYLGQILVCYGWIDEDTLKRAFGRQKATKMLLGKLLTKEFGLTEEQILKSLRIKIEETIYDIFLWDDGKFIFSPGLLGLSEHDRLSAALSIDAVIFEGARRVDEWKEFVKRFPSSDVIFEYKDGKRDIGDLGKDPVTSQIYDEIDGKKTLNRILMETHAPEFRGYESFGKLYLGGFIDSNKRAKPRPKRVVEDSKKELIHAAELFKAKKFSEAYNVIEQFLMSQPENEEAHTLFKVVRDSLLRSLYEVCLPDTIPQLTMDFADLNEQIFSSKEGYLASRINGEWDVKSLIMISPLGELDSLRILKRLYDEGMIRFDEKKK